MFFRQHNLCISTTILHLQEFRTIIQHHSIFFNYLHIKMTWLADFCLTCEAQTDGAEFCSQTCRLAELDSQPSSPTESTTQRSSSSSHHGLYLPPAIDFSVYRSPSSSSVNTIKSNKSNQSRLSEQTKSELNDYVTSFDQTRTLRRRISMQVDDHKSK